MNTAPTSVMNGLSHVCGAIASVSVINGGSAAMFTTYWPRVNKPYFRHGATAARVKAYTTRLPSSVRLNSPAQHRPLCHSARTLYGCLPKYIPTGSARASPKTLTIMGIRTEYSAWSGNWSFRHSWQ